MATDHNENDRCNSFSLVEKKFHRIQCNMVTFAIGCNAAVVLGRWPYMSCKRESYTCFHEIEK